MKRPGILMAAFISLALFSCSRDKDLLPSADKASIEGSWRMMKVKDNVTGFYHGKPGAITGDVEITFVTVSPSQGFINGKTPSNSIFNDCNLYTVAQGGKLTIPCLSITKVAETSWGIDFIYSITKSDSYTIEPDGRLRIHTTEKTLYFERN